MPDKILLCEDEENIVSFLQAELQYEGFAVDVALDGETAMSLFSQNGSDYALVLLDIMLPGKNGLECLREIRKTSTLPVIILTARKEVYDKVAFLNAGADDYVTKPFDTMELLARVKRHIQRHGETTRVKEDSRILSIDKDGYQAEVNGSPLVLTKTEFELLLYLYENMGRVATRDEIIKAVFGDYYGESNIIDANVKNIRGKIALHTPRQIIETVRGKGYVIRNG